MIYFTNVNEALNYIENNIYKKYLYLDKEDILLSKDCLYNNKIIYNLISYNDDNFVLYFKVLLNKDNNLYYIDCKELNNEYLLDLIFNLERFNIKNKEFIKELEGLL